MMVEDLLEVEGLVVRCMFPGPFGLHLVLSLLSCDLDGISSFSPILQAKHGFLVWDQFVPDFVLQQKELIQW